MGETDRVVHLFPILSGRVIPDQLRAYCGLTIRRGQAELVTVGTGMPCYMPNSWPPSGSVTTCSLGKRSSACCAKLDAMPVAGSYAAWPGAWESRRSGEHSLMCTVGKHTWQRGERGAVDE